MNATGSHWWNIIIGSSHYLNQWWPTSKMKRPYYLMIECDIHHRPLYTLQWLHNERNGISNYQPLNCLLNRLFKAQIKQTSKPHVTGLCEGNSQVTGEFPAQKASNAENVSIWWHDHVYNHTSIVQGSSIEQNYQNHKIYDAMLQVFCIAYRLWCYSGILLLFTAGRYIIHIAGLDSDSFQLRLKLQQQL